MTKMNKKNQQIKEYIISKIESMGFVADRYGNYKNADGKTRFKFQATSYRVERLIDTKPAQWMKIGGGYYKDVQMEVN